MTALHVFDMLGKPTTGEVPDSAENDDGRFEHAEEVLLALVLLEGVVVVVDVDVEVPDRAAFCAAVTFTKKVSATSSNPCTVVADESRLW
ncbi:MAG: hypothetical protein ACYDEP_00525 [Acidimicrobiales bacterium]